MRVKYLRRGVEKMNSREVKAGRWPVNPISEGKKDGVRRRR